MNLIEWVELPNLGDQRGALVVAESNKSIPFEVKRLYYIFDAQSDVPRGFHAHKALKQIAFCIQGKCKMLMDDGISKEEVWLDQANKGLLIPPMIWHEIHNFSKDCVLLVMASDYYDESDYIREYSSFQMINKLKLIPFDEFVLERSWNWLNDSELKHLTMTPDFTKEQQVELFNSLSTRKGYFIFGIAFEGQPVGACGLKNFVDDKAELWLYIGEKEYWGKGLGKRIMLLLENEARKLKLKKLYLKVIKDNKAAINLYEKFNYLLIEDKGHYIVMEKTL